MNGQTCSAVVRTSKQIVEGVLGPSVIVSIDASNENERVKTEGRAEPLEPRQAQQALRRRE